MNLLLIGNLRVNFYGFQHAKELMAAAATRGGASFSFRNEQDKIQRELESAQKDNDFIYHDKVPDVKTLPGLSKAAVAKPLPIPDKFSSNFQGKLSIKNT